MDVDAEIKDLETKRNRLTRWGILGTALYLVVIVGYGFLKFCAFLELTPNEVGDFLAGAFAPLAFLWLIIGYRMQALELEQNSKVMRQQALEMKNAVEQATVQARAATANEGYARQSIISATQVRYEEALGRLAGRLYGERTETKWEDQGICVATVTLDITLPMWQRFSAGDKELFVAKVAVEIGEESGAQALRGRLGATKFDDLTESYLRMYSGMLEIFKGLGQENIVDYYQQDTAYGSLARAIERLVDFEFDDIEIDASSEG